MVRPHSGVCRAPGRSARGRIFCAIVPRASASAAEMGHRKDLLRHRFGSRSIVQGGGASSAEMGHMKNRYAIVSGAGSLSREMAHWPRRLAIVPRFCEIVSGDTPFPGRWRVIRGDRPAEGYLAHCLGRYAVVLWGEGASSAEIHQHKDILRHRPGSSGPLPPDDYPQIISTEI
jgi:hypothetical protein